MATEAEAHQARAEHSNFLRRSGAHAIGVDRVSDKQGGTFGVVAYYDVDPQVAPPATLDIECDGEIKSVPLTAVISPRGSLE